MSFVIAIVGRPNVGKSTLFNRLTGRRLALVDDTPGVTRDRREAQGSLGGLRFTVVDTAGLEEARGEQLEARMRRQTEAAVDQADVVLFLVDARAGILGADKEFAALLRKSEKPVIVVANKFEGKAGEAGYFESFQLGLGEPVPLSAEHGTGLVELHDAIVEALGEEIAFADEEEEDRKVEGEDAPPPPLRIAVAGRPNAGKSTLINRIIGEERLLTGPEPGITRDAIAIEWQWHGRTLRLFDTAGLRRRARVQEKLEKLSVADALNAIRFAEVVIVVIDSTVPFEKQDLQIVDLVIREGRAPVIALNKFDLLDNPQARLSELREMAARLLPQVRRMKTVPVSALTGTGLDDLLTAAVEAHEAWNRRIPTARLNRWLEGVLRHHPPPLVTGRHIRIKYITQIKARPPTFVASCSRPEALPATYERYLINNLSDDFDLGATPIRLHVRKGENPYAGRARRRS